jgi:hypothetical protein
MRMNKRQQIYDDLLQQSISRRLDNIQLHKSRSSRIKASSARRSRATAAQATQKISIDCLAIGDSWFEYPLYDNGPVFEETGIVAQVQLGSMGNPPPQILNQALHGQSTTEMLKWENQQTLISLLQDPEQWLNQSTGLPDVILVSAGGDDIVGDQFVVYLDYGGGGLNGARFQGVLDSVKASYQDLFSFRDIFASNVPIVGHCYDYALPNGVVPMCVSSAWLQPSLEFAGYDYDEGVAIVKSMIDQFHNMLAGLAADPANRFVLVDTRGTITPDATSPTGWANEIHPRFGAFTNLAKQFLAALAAEFPGRV